MAGKLIVLASVLLTVAVVASAHGPVISGRVAFNGPAGKDVVDRLQKTIELLPVTVRIDKARSQSDMQKIKEANSTAPAQLPNQIQVGNQEPIAIPKVTSEQDSKKVGQTMNSFADSLKSVTDEETCDCDPKDSAKSVKALIDATSNLSQELLRCLLNSLKSVIKPREATLIRTIVKESMGALSRSVDGIYTIWKMDTQKRELSSVQAVVDGLMGVLNKFSSRLATATTSDKKSRVETVTFVVDTLVNLVANTSEAIARDVDAGLSEEQLDQIMSLAKDLAEPLTSSVLAEFVQGTARIPYINKLLLGYITESQKTSKDCEHTRAVRAVLPKAVLRALSAGLRAMNIKVASSDPSKAASSSHRVATTNFLLSLIKQNEDLLKKFSDAPKVSEQCRKRAGESVTNIGAIIKSIIDDITPDIKDPKNKQQTSLAGDLSKDFVDILSVIGSNMARPGVTTAVSNITNIIYQQYEVIRRVAKNDQAISRDSNEGIKSTISLLVDIARLEIKFVQVSVGRVRDSKDAKLRYKTVRDVNLRIIKSAVNAGRSVSPANNKPLNDLIKGSGDALAEVINELESLFAKRPQTFGDVLYEVFYSILETERKLVTSASNPSRSGLPTTVPSDVIFGLANAVRTAIDWANALTRSSGMDKNIQETLIKFVIDITVNVEDSWKSEEKDNKNIDESIRRDMKDVTDELNKILKGIQSGVTTTTVASNDYNDYSDVTPTSGISQIGSLINKLDEILQYVIEGGLNPKSSIVTRNSEVVIHIISVVFDDVSRTPHVNEDGSVDLPSGTIKPCGRDGDKPGQPGSNPGGMTTTPLPSSPETKPPQTTTAQPTTVKSSTSQPSTARPGQTTSATSGPGAPNTGRPGSPSTGRPGRPSTGRPGQTPSTSRPGSPSTGGPGSPNTGRPSRPSTGRPGAPSTGRPGSPSTGGPGSPSTSRPGSPSTGRPGRPSTGRPGSPSTGRPGSPSTTKPGQSPSTSRPGAPSTGRPGSPSTGRPGRPSTGRPGSPSTGRPGSPSTTKPGQSPSTGRPGSPSTGRPGAPGTGRPGRPSTGRPGSPSTTRPGQSPSTGRPGRPSTGRPGQSPSTGRPGSPSTGKPGSSSTTKPGQSPSTGRPGRPFTGRPGSPSTGRPGEPITGRPGRPSTGRPGSPSTDRPGSPSTARPGQSPSTGRPGRPSTGRPGSPSTGRPGSPSTTRPGESPSTSRPGGPNTGRPGRPSTGRPGSPSTGRPGSPNTGRPGGPSTGRPGSPSTGRPGSPNTGRPGRPSTGKPGSPSTTRPGESPSTSRPGGPNTGKPGRPSTGRPGSPSTGKPSSPNTGSPGRPSTGRPGSPSTGRPGSPNTGRPGAPSTGRPGSPITGGPGGPTTGRPGSPSTTRPSGPDGPDSGTCEAESNKRYLQKTHLTNEEIKELTKQITDLLNKTASRDCPRNKMQISPAVTKRITNDVLKSLSVERSMICKA